jgi:hypothetical protein
MTMLFTCAVSAQIQQLAVSQQTPEEMRTLRKREVHHDPESLSRIRLEVAPFVPPRSCSSISYRESPALTGFLSLQYQWLGAFTGMWGLKGIPRNARLH